MAKPFRWTKRHNAIRALLVMHGQTAREIVEDQRKRMKKKHPDIRASEMAMTLSKLSTDIENVRAHIPSPGDDPGPGVMGVR